jgi:hypothetical protein
MTKERVVTLDELYQFLQECSLADGLYIVGLINAAFKYNYTKSDMVDVPSQFVKWINQNFTSDQSRVALCLNTTRLARFLLLSGAKNEDPRVLDIGSKDLNHALELVLQLYDPDIEEEIKSEQDVARAFGRIAQWQFPLQLDRKTVIGRAQLLFIKIPRLFREGYDFNEKMLEYYGIDTKQFILSGVALWILSVGTLKQVVTIEVPAMKGFITQASIDKFIELSSGTPDEYRSHIRGNGGGKKDDVYGFEPFLKMPAIKIDERSRFGEKTVIVPQPFYLLERASTGIFHLLADKERQLSLAKGNFTANSFRHNFSSVYREYVSQQLKLAPAHITFIDIDCESFDGYEGKRPDFALIQGDLCVLFEVKNCVMPLTVRTEFDEKTARDAVCESRFGETVDQLCDFEKALLAKTIVNTKFNAITRVVKVLIGFDDMHLVNPFILPIARQVYGEKINHLQIGGLTDIEIIGACLGNGGEFMSMIFEKVISSTHADWPLGQFIFSHNVGVSFVNPLLQEAFHDFMFETTGGQIQL